MLLTIQGYFDSGRFIADTPIRIPEKKKTIVTVLDESIDENYEESRQTKLWDEIFEQIEKCDEILQGEPECLRLIAAFCIKHDYPLVTNNLNHFKDIEDLKAIKWRNRTEIII